MQDPAKQNPYSQKPITIPPESRDSAVDEAAAQARQDIEDILNHAEESKLPWPEVPKNVKKMNLFDLIKRVEVLNDKEDLLLWELEQADNKGDRKERIQIGDKMLDIVRLRRSLGEYVQMHEDVKGRKKDMIMTEKSPAKSKDRPGYVYLGRFNDDDFWVKEVKEEQPSLLISKKIAS